jgi:hypothetical protein
MSIIYYRFHSPKTKSPNVFNGKENGINYIQLAVKARESKTEFFIVSEENWKNMQVYSVSMGLIRILKPTN